jgi:general secretion pathway protein C
MGGEVIGMRMFGIPEDSVVSKLGLKHGDRLEAIDGEEVKDPEKALDAYVRMRTASTMNVRVTRQGEPVIIDYEIE